MITLSRRGSAILGERSLSPRSTLTAFQHCAWSVALKMPHDQCVDIGWVLPRYRVRQQLVRLQRFEHRPYQLSWKGLLEMVQFHMVCPIPMAHNSHSLRSKGSVCNMDDPAAWERYCSFGHEREQLQSYRHPKVPCWPDLSSMLLATNIEIGVKACTLLAKVLLSLILRPGVCGFYELIRADQDMYSKYSNSMSPSPNQTTCPSHHFLNRTKHTKVGKLKPPALASRTKNHLTIQTRLSKDLPFSRSYSSEPHECPRPTYKNEKQDNNVRRGGGGARCSPPVPPLRTAVEARVVEKSRTDVGKTCIRPLPVDIPMMVHGRQALRVSVNNWPLLVWILVCLAQYAGAMTAFACPTNRVFF